MCKYTQFNCVYWDWLEKQHQSANVQRDSLGGSGDSGTGSGDIAHSGRLRLPEKCGSESAISDRLALS